jgi:hypothetical protein
MNQDDPSGDKRAESRMTAMTSNRKTLKSMNFAVGCALLVMQFPVGGKLPEKPAGVRNAIELASKKIACRNAAQVAIAG